MNIVALYKTFSGHEFVSASLFSIYNHCFKIVFIHSDVSWTGETGNTVAPIVEEWKKSHDTEDKIINLYGHFLTQGEQYQFGLDWIHKNLSFDLVMMIDTDEVWDNRNLEIAKARIESLPKSECFSTHLYSYIKSIFYRIDPIELCRPTVFLRPVVRRLNGARGWDQINKALLHEVYFHHFTFVRYLEEDIRKKIATSLAGDGEGAIGTDCNTWMTEKWNQLPFADSFHYQDQVKNVWFSIKRIWKNNLPDSVVNDTNLMNVFYSPTGLLTDEEETKIYFYNQNIKRSLLISPTMRRDLAILLSLGSDKVYILNHNHYLWPYSNIKTCSSLDTIDELDSIFLSNLDIKDYKSMFFSLMGKLKPGGLMFVDNYNVNPFILDRLKVGNLITGIDYPEKGNLLITQRLSTDNEYTIY